MLYLTSGAVAAEEEAEEAGEEKLESLSGA